MYLAEIRLSPSSYSYGNRHGFPIFRQKLLSMDILRVTSHGDVCVYTHTDMKHP